MLLMVTLFTEGVDWNIFLIASLTDFLSSPSSQRVWIEIELLNRKNY